MEKTLPKNRAGYSIYLQYVLVGAALGLYYGIFHKNSTDQPDYAMAVLLSVLAGILTTAVRVWKKRKTFKVIVLDFIKIWAMFLLFLLAIESNSVVYRIGGQVAVIIFMMLVGITLGLGMAIRKKTT